MRTKMDGKKIIKGHLDVQYSPSRWSTRMCACKVMEEHFTFAKTQSEETRRKIPCDLDIPYGDTQEEKLDIIGTDLPDDAPICVFVHGGFWKALNKVDSAYPAQTLYKMGMKTFVIDYALCPHVTLKTITEQIARAFLFTLQYAERKMSREINLMGHSAGAHLVAHVLGATPATEGVRVKHAVLISGLYDLLPLTYSYPNDFLHLTEEEAMELSPLSWWQSAGTSEKVRNLQSWRDLCIHVAIAENDSPAFHDQSAQLHAAMRASHLRVDRINVRGRDHFDIMHSIVDGGPSLGDNFGDVLKQIFR